jgi:hypothetical protein
VAHALDLLVNRAVLLDVEVGPGHVGLGLVVVVVADEILDRVLGEEGLELAVKLGGQGLVGGEDQGRALHRLDDLGHGVGFAGAGDAQQDLVVLLLADAFDQLGYGRGLVAGGLIGCVDLEALAAFRLGRTRRAVRDPAGLVGQAGVEDEGAGDVLDAGALSGTRHEREGRRAGRPWLALGRGVAGRSGPGRRRGERA